MKSRSVFVLALLALALTVGAHQTSAQSTGPTYVTYLPMIMRPPVSTVGNQIITYSAGVTLDKTWTDPTDFTGQFVGPLAHSLLEVHNYRLIQNLNKGADGRIDLVIKATGVYYGYQRELAIIATPQAIQAEATKHNFAVIYCTKADPNRCYGVFYASVP